MVSASWIQDGLHQQIHRTCLWSGHGAKPAIVRVWKRRDLFPHLLIFRRHDALEQLLTIDQTELCL